MIVVAGHAPIRGDARRVVIEAATTMRRLTMDEPGCMSYRFAFALDDPDDLVVIECWNDGDALARHLSSAHFVAFSDLLRSVLDGAASFNRFEVADASPLFGSAAE